MTDNTPNADRGPPKSARSPRAVRSPDAPRATHGLARVGNILRVSPQTRHQRVAEEGARFTAQSASKEGRTTDENRAIRTPSCAARLLGCSGESLQTARFETRSRARVRAGTRPAVRIAKFGWEGFVQALGQGLVGSRVVARECAYTTRRDERTHLEPCRAAISSAAARPSGPRLIEKISRSRDAPRRFERSFGASIVPPTRGSRWCHSETRTGSVVRPDKSRTG